jgi:hypothetical protein
MPNKAVSKRQYRFFRAIQSGSVHVPGLSPQKAGEMLGHQSPKGLPASAPKKKHRLKSVKLKGK